MKNRKLLLIVSLVLALTMSLGGTLAYLTDTDADVNVMTVGNVNIVQNEQQRGENGLEQFDTAAEHAMYPVTKDPMSGYDQTYNADWEETDENVEYSMFDTKYNFVDKIVSVTNTGNTDAYVRTIFAFEMKKVDGEWVDPVGSDVKYCINNRDIDWVKDGDDYVIIDIDGVKYIVGQYYYDGESKLAPGETTPASLTQVYLMSHVGNEWYEQVGETYEIRVLSQAVQAAGFDKAETALDEAFGELNVDNATVWFNGDFPTAGSPGEEWPNNNPPTEVIRVSTSDELKAALATETEGDESVTVLMLNDIDAIVEEGTYGNVYGNVILDMNGHTLNDKSGTVQVLLRTRAGGKLTITGNGEVYSENHNTWMLYTDSDSDIIVENGTFVKAPYEWGADCGYDGCAGGTSHISNAQKLNPLICGKGVVTVYDGYFDCGILNPDYVEANSSPVVHDCMYPTINLGIDSGDDHVVIYGGTWVTANPVDGDDNPRGSTNEGNASATEKCFFLYGQEEYGVLPAGYTVEEKILTDGRTAYVYSYTAPSGN